MRALHRATLALYTDLSMEGVLQRITQSAKDLANARYAALGIPDGKGGLETFVTAGLRDGDAKRIPHQPVGRGLIGEILRSGQSIRVPEISRHPGSAGFPPGHPAMHSFLGVPIAAYGRPIGQIYLTDKIDAPEFSEEDQQLIELLAAHAAAAIENARLYRQVLRGQGELAQRNEELDLVNNLASAVASSIDVDELLQTQLERVMGLFEARAGEVFLREDHEGAFRLAVHRGMPAESFWELDRFRAGEGVIGRVGKSGDPIWTSQLESDPGYLRPSVLAAGVGTLVAVPLTARGSVVGVLSLAFDGTRPRNANQLGLLEAVGAGVGIAVENARLHRQARRLAVLEERERIGMDLHDGIIQSIYAVGLTLEYSRLPTEDPQDILLKVEEAIAGLNAIIRDIRAYILDLQPARFQTASLSEGLEMLVREFRANTLVEVDLRIEPEALGRLGRDGAAALFHIVQEALANAGKHAKASRVWVSVKLDDSRVALHVIDNGGGFDLQREHTKLGHGLENMSERARQVGGDFEIASSPGEGTTITVRLPAEPALVASRPASDVFRAAPR
ncbi:MAG TPA: GAF domain-containing protein [Anaerolineales bacterium]|nr:GAF domain-containing protein [Anaerolineales bacterium]